MRSGLGVPRILLKFHCCPIYLCPKFLLNSTDFWCTFASNSTDVPLLSKLHVPKLPLKFHCCLIYTWLCYAGWQKSSALTRLFGHIYGQQFLEGVDDADIRDNFLGKQVHILRAPGHSHACRQISWRLYILHISKPGIQKSSIYYERETQRETETRQTETGGRKRSNNRAITLPWSTMQILLSSGAGVESLPLCWSQFKAFDLVQVLTCPAYPDGILVPVSYTHLTLPTRRTV